MPKYEEWLVDFMKSKKEVTGFEKGTDYAIHGLRRFVCDQNSVWEIAFTYTDRLVLRFGPVEADGVTIKWSGWSTLHDVELPGKIKSPFVED